MDHLFQVICFPISIFFTLQSAYPRSKREVVSLHDVAICKIQLVVLVSIDILWSIGVSLLDVALI